MPDRKRILVTGGLGYVGTALVPLLAQQYDVRVYDTMMFGNSIEDTPNVEFIKGSITDFEYVRLACRDVWAIIHLAAIVTDDLVDMNPVLGRKINIQGTSNIVSAAFRMGVQRFIYVSSSSVYGTTERPATERTEPNPLTFYALTKLEAEDPVIRLADSSTSMTGTVVRMATLCGPAPRMRLDTIVNIFSAQAYFEKHINVWGGDQYRCNLYIGDAVRFYRRLLDCDPKTIDGQVFNIGGANMTARDIAEIVQRKTKAALTVDASKADNRHYMMDSTKAEKVVKWSAATPLHVAIDRNIEFFKKGGVSDYNDPIYRNTERMKSIMLNGF